ncbi:MAG: four-carbon acid sugar kinase family protein [Actinobacteria bacterium]|nr:four-carbon acid sugar kinase family protein [Actinomycetota bacterium]
MKELLIISDDLTGATNSAAFFAEEFTEIPVFIDSTYLAKNDIDFLKKNKVVVFNTNTRTAMKDQASKTVKQLSDLAAGFGDRIIIKKIDTAFRGNVAVELETIMKSTNRKMCFIINSIPAMKRITLGGFQIIDGKILENSDFSSDPYEKIKSSFIPDILGEIFSKKTGLVMLEEVKKGAKFISAKVRKYMDRKKNIIIFDSASDNDIDAIVDAVLKLLPQDSIKSTVWAGSLGLIESIKKIIIFPCPKRDIENKDNTLCKTRSSTVFSNKTCTKKTLGISASIYEKTDSQIRNAEKLNLIRIIKINIENFFAWRLDNISDEYLLNYANNPEVFGSRQFQDALDANVKSIISGLKKGSIFIVPEVSENLRKKKIEKIILKILSSIIIESFMRVNKNNNFKTALDIDRLVLIGGETSFHILKALNTKTVKIKGKIESGIDYGLISDGLIKTKELLIKGGSVGDENSVIRMICHN